MVANPEFVPLVKPTAERPTSQYYRATQSTWGPFSTTNLVLFRDQLNISTWVALGAILQAVLVIVGGRLAVLPAVALVLYRTSDAFLIATGVKRNHYMDGIIMNKFTAQYPDAQGRFGSTPANGEIVVFLIGSRTNHPMGIFAPGVKKIGDYFENMNHYLEAHAEEFGYLGGSNWQAQERTANNEIMNVMYFKTTEGLHDFAHHDIHRQGWNWWNKNIKDMPHISIWHEVYSVPKGRWESIFVNSHPDVIAATTFRIDHPDAKAEGIEPGKPFYVSPIVDARRGLLKTSAGRLSASKSKGKEHDAYNDDPYENYGKLGYVQ